MGTIRGCSYVEGKELGAGELQTKQNPTIKKQKTEVKGEPGARLSGRVFAWYSGALGPSPAPPKPGGVICI